MTLKVINVTHLNNNNKISILNYFGNYNNNNTFSIIIVLRICTFTEVSGIKPIDMYIDCYNCPHI